MNAVNNKRQRSSNSMSGPRKVQKPPWRRIRKKSRIYSTSRPAFSANVSQANPYVPVGQGQMALQKRDKWELSKMDDSPAHPQIQQKAKQLGAFMAERFVNLSEADQQAEIEQTTQLAEAIEQEGVNANVLRKDHGKKIENLVPEFTGGQFRVIQPGQDEPTQSQTSAAFSKGFAPPPGTSLKSQANLMTMKSKWYGRTLETPDQCGGRRGWVANQHR